jgi:hypothetical protein
MMKTRTSSISSAMNWRILYSSGVPTLLELSEYLSTQASWRESGWVSLGHFARFPKNNSRIAWGASLQEQ